MSIPKVMNWSAALVLAATASAAVPDAVESALASRPGEFDGKRLDAFAFDLTYAKVVEADRAADAAWMDLKSSAEIESRRTFVREKALAAIGGLPERTPLNVQSFGRISCNGFTIEKLVFESRPCFFVTAHLFLPDNPSFAAPYPGVIVPCGHSLAGKLAPTYQNVAVKLVQAGFATLIYDPFDQGEREQLPGKGLMSVTGHSNAGLRAHLLGWSAAQFRIWDGIRAHDLLLSRPEVDPKRTAVTGMSGGGTLSAYLNALDGRFRAAAPMGFLTSMRGLIDRCGPQDAEQVIFGSLAFGFNHLSLMVLNGQSALLPGFTYGDIFPYEGALATFDRARTVYRREGRDGLIDCLACPGPHGWYQSEKAALIAWFRHHLAGDGSAWPVDRVALRRLDVGFRYAKAETGLTGRPEGEVLGGRGVMALPDARNVYDLMADELTRIEMARPETLSQEGVRAACGLKERPFVVLDESMVETNAYVVKRACLEQMDGFRAFVTAFFPKTAKGTPVLIASDTREPSALAPQVRACLDEGRPVAVAEARAFGPISACYARHTYWAKKGLDQEIAAMHVWLGKDLAVGRAEDYLAAAKWFKDQTGRPAELRAEGGAVVAAAHAFYFGRDRLSGFWPSRAPASWSDMVRHPTTPLPRLSDLVHGALKAYDWVDLVHK